MKIIVDADACPNIIKEIIFRAAKRLNITTILFANHSLTIPTSSYIKFVQVPKGFDVADNKIVEEIAPGDLVITADIPLAASVIEKNGHALNPRGEFYSKENIKQILTMRNFMTDLRSTGQNIGGPPPLSKRNQLEFANALDSFLAKHS